MLKTAWFIIPFRMRDGAHFDKSKPVSITNRPVRRCEILDYKRDIVSEGGNTAMAEVLGDRCIVKVKAEETTLAMLASKYKRIPKDLLDDSLSDLPAAAKLALKNELLDMGYSLQEIQDKFGSDLGNYALRDVLKFMLKRRLTPAYDVALEKIVCTGAERPTMQLEDLDSEVQ